MKKILEFIIKISLFPIANWLVEVDNQAPMCCGNKTDFVGSHTSLWNEGLFYQCDVCKKVTTITNEHKGINLGQFWRALIQR